jgi:hypothetical protein
MTPIYDRVGKIVAWLFNHRLILYCGRHVAFVDGEAVYTLKGEYLGRFRSGFFRDPRGGAVAFVHGAKGGPPLPFSQLQTLPPLPPLPPIAPLPPLAPLAPPDSFAWGIPWDAFVGHASQTEIREAATKHAVR